MSISRWMDKKAVVHIHYGILAIKKKLFEPVLMRWMKLEPIIQSEVSQKEKHQYSMWSEVTQSCPTLSDPMDCSPSGSPIYGISQARILEWVAISFSRGSFQHRDWTGLLHCGQILYHLSYKGTSGIPYKINFMIYEAITIDLSFSMNFLNT